MRTLSNSDKKRIRKEEIFRKEVQRKLDDEKPSPSRKKRIWDLLNSSFVLWFLSTLVIGLFGWMYSNYQERAKADNQKKELIRKLDTEINNRLQDTNYYLYGLKATAGNKNTSDLPILSPISVFERTIKRLDGIEAESNRPLVGVYPEYKERGFVSLVIELKSVVEEDEQDKLETVISSFGSFRQRISEEQGSNISKKDPLSGEEAKQLMVGAVNHAEYILLHFGSKRWIKLDIPID
jgi:hypothetical protein